MTVTLSELPDRVVQWLSAEGPLSSRVKRFAPSAEQQDYARRIARLLVESAPGASQVPATALLEAATGTGKTLGYLLPLIAYSALTRRRIAISTYTLHLLYQIQDSLPVALAAVAEGMQQESVSHIPFAFRVGMSEFVSPHRVAEALADGSWTKTERRQLERLLHFASDGSGVLSHFDGHLPGRLGQDDVVLTPLCPPEARSVYDQHVQRAREARILICTQATLLRHALGQVNALNASEDPLEQIETILIDEADRLSNMAETISSFYVPLRDLSHELSGLKGSNEASRACTVLQERISDLKSVGGLTYLTQSNQAVHRASIAAGVRDLCDRLRTVCEINEGDVQSKAIDGTRRSLEAIQQSLHSDQPWRLAYVRTSAVRGYAGLGCQTPRPGTALSLLWRKSRTNVRRLILTSATLTTGTERSMRQVASSVGIPQSDPSLRQDLSGCIEPRRFGTLHFVFADPSAPTPHTTAGDEFAKREEWLNYAAHVIEQAAAANGRVLVLCPSYDDVEHLAPRLPRRLSANVLAQSREGGDKASCLKRFVDNASAIWLTPSCWEGLDLPGLIRHVVIPRIPYPSMEGAGMKARQLMLAGAGYDPKRAASATFAEARALTLRKLKQGLGRPIRSRHDRATIWFADPRLPPFPELEEALFGTKVVCKSSVDRGLLAAVPRRFAEDEETVRESAIAIFPSGKPWKPLASE